MEEIKEKFDRNYQIHTEDKGGEYTNELDELIDFVINSAENKKISPQTRDLLLNILLTRSLKEQVNDLSRFSKVFNKRDSSSIMMKLTNNKKQYV